MQVVKALYKCNHNKIAYVDAACCAVDVSCAVVVVVVVCVVVITQRCCWLHTLLLVHSTRRRVALLLPYYARPRWCIMLLIVMALYSAWNFCSTLYSWTVTSLVLYNMSVTANTVIKHEPKTFVKCYSMKSPNRSMKFILWSRWRICLKYCDEVQCCLTALAC